MDANNHNALSATDPHCRGSIYIPCLTLAESKRASKNIRKLEERIRRRVKVIKIKSK